MTAELEDAPAGPALGKPLPPARRESTHGDVWSAIPNKQGTYVLATPDSPLIQGRSLTYLATGGLVVSAFLHQTSTSSFSPPHIFTRLTQWFSITFDRGSRETSPHPSVKVTLSYPCCAARQAPFTRGCSLPALDSTRARSQTTVPPRVYLRAVPGYVIYCDCSN